MKWFSRIKKLSKQQIVILCKAGLLGLFFAMVFYNSWLGIFILFPCLPVYQKREKEKLWQRRQKKLRGEFLEFLKLIIHGLEVGYSIEHCLEQVCIDYEREAEQEKSLIVPELLEMQRKLQMNIPVHEILKAFAERTELPEADSFTQIIEIARRSGGNLQSILKRTVNTMLEKEKILEEIETMISGKKIEQRVMSVMPVGILLYMKITSGNYMKPLYGNLFGIAIATIGLFLTLFAIIWSEKIVDISI